MIAQTPHPPYVAVIFSSLRRERFYAAYALRVATVGRQHLQGAE